MIQPPLKSKSLSQHHTQLSKDTARALFKQIGRAVLGVARILREILQLLCKVNYSPVSPEIPPPLLRLVYLGTICLNLTVNKKSIIKVTD